MKRIWPSSETSLLENKAPRKEGYEDKIQQAIKKAAARGLEGFLNSDAAGRLRGPRKEASDIRKHELKPDISRVTPPLFNNTANSKPTSTSLSLLTDYDDEDSNDEERSAEIDNKVKSFLDDVAKTSTDSATAEEYESLDVEQLQATAHELEQKIPPQPSETLWKTVRDENSKEDYYWHTGSGKTQWEMPAELDEYERLVKERIEKLEIYQRVIQIRDKKLKEQTSDEGKLGKKVTAKECIDSENGLREKLKEDATSIGTQCKSQTVNKLGVKKAASVGGVAYVEETEKDRTSRGSQLVKDELEEVEEQFLRKRAMLLKGSSNGSATKDSISSSEPNMHAAKVKEEAERMIKQKEHLMGVEMAAVISDICGRSGMLLCKLTDRMGQEAKMLRKEVESKQQIRMQDAAYFGRPDVKDTSGCLGYFKYSLERLIEIEESAERMQAVAEGEGYRPVLGTQNDNDQESSSESEEEGSRSPKKESHEVTSAVAAPSPRSEATEMETEDMETEDMETEDAPPIPPRVVTHSSIISPSIPNPQLQSIPQSGYSTTAPPLAYAQPHEDPRNSAYPHAYGKLAPVDYRYDFTHGNYYTNQHITPSMPVEPPVPPPPAEEEMPPPPPPDSEPQPQPPPPEKKAKKEPLMKKSNSSNNLDAAHSTVRKKKKLETKKLPRGKKEMIEKWNKVKDSEEDDDPMKAREKSLEQWHSQQLASGQAATNSNFQPIVGDWRDKIRQAKVNQAKLASDELGASGTDKATATPTKTKKSGHLNFKFKPDLKVLSEGLPSGWRAMWDSDSGDVYYGNLTTRETSWEWPS